MTTRPVRGHEAGQALPEFAIIAPIFFLVLLGIIQLGLLLSGQNGLTNAARESARYASTLPTPDTIVAGDCATTATNSRRIFDRLRTVSMPQYVAAYQSANLVIPANLATCGASALAGTATGVGYCRADNGDGTWSVRVRVVVVYRHPLFIPLVGRILSSTNTWQLGATEEMRVEGPNRALAQVSGFGVCP